MSIVRGYSTDPKIQVGFYGDLHQVCHQYYEMVEGRVLAQRRILNVPQIRQNQFPEFCMNCKRRHRAGVTQCEKQNAGAIRSLVPQMFEKV